MKITKEDLLEATITAMYENVKTLGGNPSAAETERASMALETLYKTYEALKKSKRG